MLNLLRRLLCPCKHDWSKWEIYYAYGSWMGQRKTCSKCSLVKTRVM